MTFFWGRRALLDLALLALLAAAAALSVVQLQPLSALVVLLAMCVVPGAAILTRVGTTDSLTTAALAVGLSLAVDTAVAAALAWSGYWHPTIAAAAIAAAAALLLIADLYRNYRHQTGKPVEVPIGKLFASSEIMERSTQDTQLLTGPLRTAGVEDHLALAGVAPDRRVSLRGSAPVNTCQVRQGVTDAQQAGCPASSASSARKGWLRLCRALGWFTVLAPVALWSVSLGDIDLEGIGRYGLSASLPAAWYAALVILLLGAIRTTVAPRFDGVLAAAHVAVAVLIAYATIPAVAEMPQYAWTFKHVGVTNSIELMGSAAPLTDIYHRWPGFFALAAAFSRLSGLGDPMSYAAWSEPMFSLLGALLVAAIARTVSRSSQVAGLAALFFVLSAWVAQSYFAPQPLAYVLGLTLMLVVLRQLIHGERWPRWIVRRVGAEAAGPTLGWSRRTTLAVVVGLDAVIVVTHQLSPYMILLGLAALAVLGVLRSTWMVIPAIALPAVYLLLHLRYVADNFPVFTSINPSENWGARADGTTEPWLVAHAGGMVSACMCLLAVLAVAALARRRAGPAPLMVLALAIAPAFTVLGASYGGEASLRVHYFAAPWLAVLVAWGLASLPRRIWRTGATALALAAVTTFFLVSFFGRTALNVMPRDAVEASAYFYDHAEANSLLVLVNPGFPMRLSARYTAMSAPEGGDTSPNLMLGQNADRMRRGDLTAVSSRMRQLAGPSSSVRRYVVFSRSEALYAHVNRILTIAQTRRLERAVARSPEFRLWHRTTSTRIYEALGR